MLTPRTSALILIVLAAAATRLLPHPPNFTSLHALALFSGACFADRRLAFAVPCAALLLSDLVLGFYDGMLVQYLAAGLVVLVGLAFRPQRSVGRLAASGLLAALVFFVTTNFGVWALGTMYPTSIEGLLACYVAAIPFFGNSLAGDLFYAGLLFGGLRLLEQRYTALRAPASFGGALGA